MGNLIRGISSSSSMAIEGAELSMEKKTEADSLWHVSHTQTIRNPPAVPSTPPLPFILPSHRRFVPYRARFWLPLTLRPLKLPSLCNGARGGGGGCWVGWSQGSMAGDGTADTLEQTPTWVVAVVCTVIVFISLVVERSLHYLGKARLLHSVYPTYSLFFVVCWSKHVLFVWVPLDCLVSTMLNNFQAPSFPLVLRILIALLLLFSVFNSTSKLNSWFEHFYWYYECVWRIFSEFIICLYCIICLWTMVVPVSSTPSMLDPAWMKKMEGCIRPSSE